MDEWKKKLNEIADEFLAIPPVQIQITIDQTNQVTKKYNTFKVASKSYENEFYVYYIQYNNKKCIDKYLYKKLHNHFEKLGIDKIYVEVTESCHGNKFIANNLDIEISGVMFNKNNKNMLNNFLSASFSRRNHS